MSSVLLSSKHVVYIGYFAIGVVSIVVLNVFIQALPTKYHGMDVPPTVFHLFPLLGSTIEFGRNPTQFLIDCQKKYGNIFTFVILGKKMTAVLGPRGNRFVTGMKSDIFNAEDIYGRFTAPVFGKDVAFDVPNEVFKEQKRMLSVGLSTSNFRIYTGIIEEEVDSYINGQLIPSVVNKQTTKREWSSFDAYHVLSTLNILASTRTLHGKEVHTSICLGSKIVSYYDELDASLGPMTFIFPHLPLPQYYRRDHARRELSRIYLNLVRGRKEHYTKGSHEDAFLDPDDESDLIAALIRQKSQNGKPLQDHVIANLMVALLMAGRHTSVATGTWILIYLAANSSVADNLYAEQMKYFKLPNGSSRNIVYDDIQRLPLLNAVIRETLRLQPPIHSISRMVRDDTVVPLECGNNLGRSFIIPRGHVVTASFAVCQLDSKFWSHPEEWNPYRWLNSAHGENTNVKLEGSEASAFQPFGGGGHRCIGEQYAMMQLSIIVLCFVRAFEMRVEKQPGRTQFTTVTLPSDSKIYFRQREINEVAE